MKNSQKAPSRRLPAAPTWAFRWLLTAMVMVSALAVTSLRAVAEEPEQPSAPAPKAEAAAADGVDPAADWGLDIESVGNDELDAQVQSFRTGGGQLALLLPWPLRIRYAAASFEMRANGAVVWVTPAEEAELEAVEAGDPTPGKFNNFLGAVQRVKEVQLYAEGPVWLKYGVGAASSTLRADTVFLTIRRSDKLDVESGMPVFTLSGVVEGAKAHTSKEGAAAITGKESSEDAVTGLPIVKVLGAGGDAEPDGVTGLNRKQAAEGLSVVMPRKDIFDLERGRRIFVRSDRLRIIEASSSAAGQTDLESVNSQLSSSSLAIPGYSFSSKLIQVRLRGTRRVVILDKPGLDIGGTRLLSWPAQRYTHDLDSRFPITRLDISRSDAFGYYFRTRVDAIALYDTIYDPDPPFRPFQLSPLFEWYEDRGMATGLEFELPRIRPFSTGTDASFQGYYIGDRGDQRDVARTLGFFPLRSVDRGRFRGWARHRNRNGFALDAHLNYESDSSFLQEFFRNEFLSNEQERTFVRLRRELGNRSFWMDVGVRTRDFRDEVERLPVVGFGTWREPIGPRSVGLQLTGEGEFGNYRVRSATPGHPVDNRMVLRGDLGMRVTRPFDLGILTLDPYLGFRATAADTRWIGTPAGNPLYDGSVGFVPASANSFEREGVARVQGLFGVSAQTHLVRTWAGPRSEFLDISGIRHIVTPSVRWENVAGPSRRAWQFMQMDEIDALENENRVTLGVRNRFQTRRVRHGEDSQSTVDLLDVLVELPAYPNRDRDNGGERFGDLEVRGIANPSNYLQLRGGGFFDSSTMDWNRLYAAAAFPIGDIEAILYARALRNQHEIVGASLGMDLSGTYRVELEQEYDVLLNQTRDTLFRLTRNFAESFSLRLAVRRDAITRDLGISISAAILFGG